MHDGIWRRIDANIAVIYWNVFALAVIGGLGGFGASRMALVVAAALWVVGIPVVWVAVWRGRADA